MTPFLEHISALCTAYNISQPIAKGFLRFCKDYERACLAGGSTPDSALFGRFLETVSKQFTHPYQFAMYHIAERKPIDYYQMGLDFVRPLIDFSHSSLLGKEHLLEIQKSCSLGENTILLANHHTEIDPQVISLLIQQTAPDIAENMIFVAGHRVTADPLAVPFSIGRNLIRIYSKRHVAEPPEKRAEKLKHNQNALAALQKLLDTGGVCVFIAPSGGRDRKGPDGVVEVAPFDPDSIEMLLLLAKKAKAKTHFHTLTLSTYDLLPPPDSVLSEIGEERSTSFSPAHLCFGRRLDITLAKDQLTHEEKRAYRQKRASSIWQEVVNSYHSF